MYAVRLKEEEFAPFTEALHEDRKILAYATYVEPVIEEGVYVDAPTYHSLIISGERPEEHLQYSHSYVPESTESTTPEQSPSPQQSSPTQS